MVGPTAQIVALTCHLNAALRRLPIGSFFPENSTCQFCERIEFARPRRQFISWGAEKWTTVCHSPDRWIEQLLASGVRRAYLHHESRINPPFSDRMLAGLVGGGGRWCLGVSNGESIDVWESTWDVGQRDAPDQRIWRVRYCRVEQTRPWPQPPMMTLESRAVELDELLNKIADFALQHDLGGFADSFQHGRACLQSDDPLTLVYHKDLAPHGLLGLPALRLLACAQAAWVFGGMGSWNDLGFEGQDHADYETLSDAVFDKLNSAICCATNSVEF